MPPSKTKLLMGKLILRLLAEVRQEVAKTSVLDLRQMKVQDSSCTQTRYAQSCPFAESSYRGFLTVIFHSGESYLQYPRGCSLVFFGAFLLLPGFVAVLISPLPMNDTENMKNNTYAVIKQPNNASTLATTQMKELGYKTT